jgi:hypothetical protein
MGRVSSRDTDLSFLRRRTPLLSVVILGSLSVKARKATIGRLRLKIPTWTPIGREMPVWKDCLKSLETE